MKIKMIITCEDDFEKQAVIDCVKNKLKLESIYADVFRPIIKYNDDDELVKAYSLVWESLANYLGEE